jgi:hypothetical protein
MGIGSAVVVAASAALPIDGWNVDALRECAVPSHGEPCALKLLDDHGADAGPCVASLLASIGPNAR